MSSRLEELRRAAGISTKPQTNTKPTATLMEQATGPQIAAPEPAVVKPPVPTTVNTKPLFQGRTNDPVEVARNRALEQAQKERDAFARLRSRAVDDMDLYRTDANERKKANLRYQSYSDKIAAADDVIRRATEGIGKDWETEKAAEIEAAGGYELLLRLVQIDELEAQKIKDAAARGDERRTELTENERTYNAMKQELRMLYGDKVDGWLEYVDRIRNKKQTEATLAKTAEKTKDSKVGMSAASVLTNKLAGIGYVDVIGQKLQRRATGSNAPIDYNSPAQLPSKVTNTIRSTVSEDMGGVGSFLYNTGMGIADSVTSIPLGKAGRVLLGASAATNAMQEAVARGATDNQALAMGLVAGTAETLLENASIESLFNLKNAKTAREFVWNLFKQGGVELTEEGASNLVNTVADALVMGDKSEYETAKRAYLEDGKTAEQAELKAFTDWFSGFALDAFSGLLSGFAMGGGKSGIDYLRNNRGGNQTTVDGIMPTIPQAEQMDRPAQTVVSAAPTVDSVMPKVQPEQTMQRQPRVGAVMPDIGQNKTAPAVEAETESTSVNTNPAAHTPQEQAVIDAYQGSVDENLVRFAERVKDGSVDVNKARYNLNPIPDRAVPKIRQITGVDASGFATVFEGRMVDHTIKRHGENGAADQSMRDLNDIGRIQYVIDNYDDIKDGGTTKAYTTNKPSGKSGLAKTVVFEKAVNGTYYVVEAVPDTKAKTTYVVSAYMSKNGAEQLTDATNAPVFTAETGFAQTPNLSISNSSENVNGENIGGIGANPAMGAADSGFDPYSHASLEYGAIKPGENPARVVDVPKSMDGNSNVMQTVRTIMEADATPDAAIPELEQAVVNGEFSRMPITDQAAAERAENTIRRVGYQQALADWQAEVRNGHVSKDSVAVGETLYNAAVNAGDLKSAVKIAVDLATQVRSAAQALQAVRMLKKMSPAAQLYGVKQSVDNLQKTLTDKYGKRAPDLVINEDLAARFLEAQTDAERAAAEKALYKDIAKQIPATFADKWNAWRYLSMLGNVRTHVRNVAGNAMFAPVRGVKNTIKGLMESGAQAAGLIDKSQRTTTLLAPGKDLLNAAKADYANVRDQILGGGKYNSASDAIDKNRQIFEPRGAKLVGKAVERITRKTLPQWTENISIEGLRKGNSWLLDAEDSFFSKGAYAFSLAKYLKAQGFTAADFTGNGMTDNQKDAARAYAIKEAQKATYRDINGFSEAISSIGFKAPGDSKTKHVINAMVEGIMPFKKTPANILARSVEYSPAGLVKALTLDTAAVAKGKISAGEYMDRLASGLTGTGLFALGWLLSNSGLLVGGTPEDEDQADLEGRQPCALEIDGKSITLDWLAPEAMPVFMGVELAEAIRESGGDAAFTDKVDSFLQGLSGPMLEMSMMSALQDAMEATEYADNKPMAFLANGALGYLKQALPTLFGQLERSIESSVRETTFTQEGNKYLGKDVQYTVGSTANKIPGVDYNQIPYIDAWGRVEEQGDMGTRLVNNMLNPAYVSDIQETPVDREIKRLEKQTGANLTPARAKATLTIDGKKVLLTSEEYVTYAKARGQNDLTFRQSLIDAESYGSLDDPTKVKAMELARDLADALAVREAGFDDPKMTDWQKELIGADINIITETLVKRAIDSQAGMLGENKYLGLNEMLESNTIDDQLALACMSESSYTAYTELCKPAGVSVQQFLDVYGTAYASGENAEQRRTAALENIRKMDIPAEQKTALAQAAFSVFADYFRKESEVPDQWLLDNGDIDRLEIQMGRDEEKQPERYVEYEKYIKDSSVDMQTYLDFYNFAKGVKNRDGNSRQDQIIAYLEKLDATDEVKGRLFCTEYKRSSCPLKWRMDVPRD